MLGIEFLCLRNLHSGQFDVVDDESEFLDFRNDFADVGVSVRLY